MYQKELGGVAQWKNRTYKEDNRIERICSGMLQLVNGVCLKESFSFIYRRFGVSQSMG